MATRKRNQNKKQEEPFFKPNVVKPRSKNQTALIHSIQDNVVTCAYGPAGCGKTHVGVGVAVKLLKDESQSFTRIVVSRPAVEGGGERLGFLPGGPNEKIDPYLRPLYDELGYFISKAGIQSMKYDGTISVVPLAFMRGLTFNNAIIIVDEVQNATYEQLKMVWTRLGVGSKLMFLGDIEQSDLSRHDQGGYVRFVNTMMGLEDIGVIELEIIDICRHEMVKKMLDREVEVAQEKKNATEARNQDSRIK